MHFFSKYICRSHFCLYICIVQQSKSNTMNATQMYNYWKDAKPTETFEQFAQSIKSEDWPALYEGLIYESISFEEYCNKQYFEYANQLWHSETYCITPEGTVSFDICSCAHCSCSHLSHLI